MPAITESRFAMYEGIIALAWVDHTLDASEKQSLHTLIDSNPHFTPEQRARLHADIDRKVALEDVWPRITEKKDRAHLLDMANVIFHQDGNFCDTEKEVYERYLAKHLATIDSEQTAEEIQQLAADFRVQREQEEQAIKEYAERFSLPNAIKRLWTRLKD